MTSQTTRKFSSVQRPNYIRAQTKENNICLGVVLFKYNNTVYTHRLNQLQDNRSFDPHR